MVNFTKDSLEEAVKNSFNIGQTIQYLNGSISGTKYDTIRKYVKKWNIDTSHFNSYARHQARKDSMNITLKDLLVNNGQHKRKNQKIKQMLIEENYKIDECEKCGQGNKHNGEPLVLQLDHINGNNKDNRLENLRILCPNCHTQTRTWGNKKRTTSR